MKRLPENVEKVNEIEPVTLAVAVACSELARFVKFNVKWCFL